MKLRAGRGRAARRRPARAHARRPGRDPDRQHRVAEVGAGDGRRTRCRPTELGRAGPQRAADPPAARARRPRRHAEVRLRRRAPGAGAGQRPGDRRPGRARRGGQGVPGPGPRRDGALPRGAHRRRSPCRTGRCPGPDDLAAVDASPVRCFDPATSDAMVAEIDAARKDGDTLGGVVEVRRARPAAGPGQPRARRPPAGRPAGRRADGHPGDQGRRGRRRVRPGPPPRLARRTTRSRAARPGCAGAPGAPAAPRAA